jgi:hypothetical protein
MAALDPVTLTGTYVDEARHPLEGFKLLLTRDDIVYDTDHDEVSLPQGVMIILDQYGHFSVPILPVDGANFSLTAYPQHPTVPPTPPWVPPLYFTLAESLAGTTVDVSDLYPGEDNTGEAGGIWSGNVPILVVQGDGTVTVTHLPSGVTPADYGAFTVNVTGHITSAVPTPSVADLDAHSVAEASARAALEAEVALLGGTALNRMPDTYSVYTAPPYEDSRERWHTPQNMARDTNPTRSPYGFPTLVVHNVTDSGGKFMWLDEAGLLTTDALSFAARVKAAAGVTLRLVVAWYNDLGVVGSVVAGPTQTPNGVAVTLLNQNITPPNSTVTRADVYVQRTAGTADFDIYAMWAAKGATAPATPLPSAVPAWIWTDLANSAGSAGSLTNRLSVSMEDDGTLKDDVFSDLNNMSADLLADLNDATGSVLADSFDGPFYFETDTLTPAPDYSELQSADHMTIDDTSNKYRVERRRLVADSAATSLHDPVLSGEFVGREPGVCFILSPVKGASFSAGWSLTTDDFVVRTGVNAGSGVFSVFQGSGSLTTGIAHDPTLEYHLAIVLAVTGSTIYYRTNLHPWKFMWAPQMHDTGDFNTATPVKWQFAYSGAVEVKPLGMFDLGGPWSFINGPTYYRNPRPSATEAGTLPEGDGALSVELDVVSGSTAEIRFRQSAPDSYWFVRASENLDQASIGYFNAGVPVAKDVQTYVVAPGAIHRLSVRWEGDEVHAQFMPGSLIALHSTGDAFNAGAKGWSLAAGSAIPSALAVYRLGAVPVIPPAQGTKGLLCVVAGDSKSVVLDPTPEDFPIVGHTMCSWEVWFEWYAEITRGAGAHFIQVDATGGREVGDWLTTLPAKIAEVVDTGLTPDVYYWKLGTNHRGEPGMVNEAALKATFQANMLDGLDMVHAAWPLCKVIVTIPSGTDPGWPSGADDVIAVWITEVVDRLYYARLGLDERKLLRDPALGWIGADGTHPTGAGYQEIAHREAELLRDLFPPI